jgi:multiple antibiotic resistance protein
METAQLVTAFVTLFVVIDPVGLAPLFVALTQGMEARQRRRIALRACLISVGLLTVFGLFGEAVLAFVGISMPAFRIAGGILLFLTALDMLFERRRKRREDQARDSEEDPEDDPSVFPLATPLIAGPGAMATMILLTGGPEAGWEQIAAMHGVMLAVILVVLLFFLAAGLLERALGPTGINVATRLLGMLLAALSVQFVLDGLKSFGFVG